MEWFAIKMCQSFTDLHNDPRFGTSELCFMECWHPVWISVLDVS